MKWLQLFSQVLPFQKAPFLCIQVYDNEKGRHAKDNILLHGCDVAFEMVIATIMECTVGLCQVTFFFTMVLGGD